MKDIRLELQLLVPYGNIIRKKKNIYNILFVTYINI